MPRTIVRAALLLAVALAAPACAAEGALEIFPDIVPVLLEPCAGREPLLQLLVLFVLLIVPGELSSC